MPPRKISFLITIDALRYADIFDKSGNPVSDSVSAILNTVGGAKLYTNMFATASVTQMAYPAMFCGNLPLSEGGYNFGILNRRRTFVERLAKLDTQCVAFSTDYVAGELNGYNRGFQEYHSFFDLAWIFHTFVSTDLSWVRTRPRVDSEHLSFLRGKVLQILDYSCAVCQQLEVYANSPDPRLHHILDWDFSGLRNAMSDEIRNFQSNSLAYIDDLINNPDSFFSKVASLRVAPYYPDADFVLEACLQSDVLRADGDCFFWVNLSDVHGVLYDDMHPESPAEGKFSAFRTLLGGSRVAERYPEHGTRSSKRAIHFVFHQLFQFVQNILRLYPQSEIKLIVTSDHGSKTKHRAHLYQMDNFYFFDELLHVPFIVLDSAGESGVVHCRGMYSMAQLGDFVLSLAKGCKYPKERELIFHENNGPGPVFLREKPIRICARSAELKLTSVFSPRGDIRDVHAFACRDDPDEEENLLVHAECSGFQFDSLRRATRRRFKEIFSETT